MKNWFVWSLFVAVILCGCNSRERMTNLGKDVSEEREEVAVIVIDPGHGGNDPGKVAASGEREKDINLQIAQKVKKVLEKKGYTVVMTREDDMEGIDFSQKKQKLEDMQKRVALINEIQPRLAVSIHQNSFPDSSVRGAQVFYYRDSVKGRELAQAIQTELWTVDKENQRQIKDNENYYMLLHTEVPTVIVECGFLSNAEETKKLLEESYQDLLVEAICNGVTKWLDK